MSSNELNSVVILGIATPMMFMSRPWRKIPRHRDPMTTANFHERKCESESSPESVASECSLDIATVERREFAAGG